MNITAYLLRDAAGRWREQPYAPLARFAVASLVASLSLSALSVIGVAERVLEARLVETGVDVVTVTSPLIAGEVPVGADRFSSLAAFGESVPLVRLHRVGTSDYGARVAVYAYDDRVVPMLARYSVSPHIYVGAMPVGMSVRVSLDDRDVQAVEAGSKGVLRRIPKDAGTVASLLVPFSEVADLVAAEGGIEVLVFERAAKAPPVREIVSSINRFAEADDARLTVASAAPLMNEMDALRERRKGVQGDMALIVAVAVSLVFGALALLEYRESRYVSGLLRSMGISAKWILAQVICEGVAVAVVAVIAASWAVPLLAGYAARAFGLDASVAASVPSVVLSPGVILPVALALVVGAVVAAIPVAVAMTRKDVGEVLS